MCCPRCSWTRLLACSSPPAIAARRGVRAAARTCPPARCRLGFALVRKARRRGNQPNRPLPRRSTEVSGRHLTGGTAGALKSAGPASQAALGVVPTTALPPQPPRKCGVTSRVRRISGGRGENAREREEEAGDAHQAEELTAWDPAGPVDAENGHGAAQHGSAGPGQSECHGVPPGLAWAWRRRQLGGRNAGLHRAVGAERNDGARLPSWGRDTRRSWPSWSRTCVMPGFPDHPWGLRSHLGWDLLRTGARARPSRPGPRHRAVPGLGSSATAISAS